MNKPLGKVIKYSTDRISLDEVNVDTYVTTDNLLQNKLGKTKAVGLPPQGGNVTKYEKGDILIANIRPYLKKIWFSNQQGGSSADVLTLKVNEDYEPSFVYYSLFRDDFFEHMMNGAKGTKMPRGDKNQILDFPIPSFELHTQKAIAKVLSDLDTKIELNNKINAELEAMAKLIYDYWFVQFEFPATTSSATGKPHPEPVEGYKSSGGKMVYNEELKREIPEGWEVYSLSSLLKHNYNSLGKNHTLDKIEYLDTSSLTKNSCDDTQALIIGEDKIPSRAQRIVNKNDILYSTVRPNLCHYGIIKHPIKNMVASTGFAQLSSKKEWLSNDLIYAYLTSSWVTERLHQIAALSVSAYPSISPNDILELNIALPKEGKGLAFINNKFDFFYSKISYNQKENQQLASLRDWLLPMLMNGQVTVRQAHGSAAKEAAKKVIEFGIAAEPESEYGM